MTHYKIHVYPNQLNITCLKEWEIHSPCFLKLLELNGANHLILEPEFLVFQCKWYCERLSWIVRVNVVLNRTVVVDSD